MHEQNNNSCRDGPNLVLAFGERRRTEKRYRQPRARDVARAWARAGVSRRVWEGSPHHAFRRGFKSEMMRAGAPPDAVDYLQGHIPKGGRGRYIDMHRAFEWDEVVGMIPAAEQRLGTVAVRAL